MSFSFPELVSASEFPLTSSFSVFHKIYSQNPLFFLYCPRRDFPEDSFRSASDSSRLCFRFFPRTFRSFAPARSANFSFVFPGPFPNFPSNPTEQAKCPQAFFAQTGAGRQKICRRHKYAPIFLSLSLFALFLCPFTAAAVFPGRCPPSFCSTSVLSGRRPFRHPFFHSYTGAPACLMCRACGIASS